ncbi:MAG: DNA alkylation repair protein [Chloroflexota bacterium]
MINPYLKPLITLFEENAHPENAPAMEKYMRNQFPFFGIKTPERKSLVKRFLKENGLPAIDGLEAITRDLWHLPEREYQYTAMTLLDRMRKQIPVEFITLYEDLITTKSWWDTIDGLASHEVGDVFKRSPEIKHAYLNRWRASDNFWLRRTTLLFQLGYKDDTDEALLFSLIRENLGSDEFFINKAIGWALREYSKRQPQAVIQFVADTPLVPLSEREALKWLKNKGQLKSP